MAVCMAMEPSLVAGREARLLLKLPIGVRTALIIKTSCALESFPKFLLTLKDWETERNPRSCLQLALRFATPAILWNVYENEVLINGDIPR